MFSTTTFSSLLRTSLLVKLRKADNPSKAFCKSSLAVDFFGCLSKAGGTSGILLDVGTVFGLDEAVFFLAIWRGKG